MTTKKPTAKPEAKVEARPTPPPPDPTRCQCTNVPRRYDGDGLLERGEPNTYRCAVCGKAYS